MNKPDNYLYFDDFREGQVFPLPEYKVSKEEIIAYASEFDPQPHHLTEEGGRNSLLGRMSASGWHVSAIGMRMLDEGLYNHSSSAAGISVDEVRWLKPVSPGDVLVGRVEVIEARASARHDDRGYLKLKMEIFDGNICVMTLVTVGMFMRRPKTETLPANSETR
jgi:acyl dehydratase